MSCQVECITVSPGKIFSSVDVQKLVALTSCNSAFGTEAVQEEPSIENGMLTVPSHLEVISS